MADGAPGGPSWRMARTIEDLLKQAQDAERMAAQLSFEPHKAEMLEIARRCRELAEKLAIEERSQGA